MSADNYAVCPRCSTTNRQSGPYPTEPTFREDYEIYGAETGELIIHYRGRCTVCGLSTEVNDAQVFFDLTSSP